MFKRNRHEHVWEMIGASPTIKFNTMMGDRPTGYTTDIALRCMTCGDVRSKTINGTYKLVDGALAQLTVDELRFKWPEPGETFDQGQGTGRTPTSRESA